MAVAATFVCIVLVCCLQYTLTLSIMGADRTENSMVNDWKIERFQHLKNKGEKGKHSLRARCGDVVIEMKYIKETQDLRCHRLDKSSFKYDSSLINVPEEHASEFLQLCDSLKSYDHQLPRRQKRFLDIIKSVLFMVPGTKWCGWGYTAQNFDDLGQYNVTDVCCRAHDHCAIYIDAWSSNYGLSNHSPVSRRPCTCEEQFYKCLVKAAKKEPAPAALTGSMYFNVLDYVCISATPRRKCLEWGWFGYCRRYSKTEMENYYTDNRFTFPSIEGNTTDIEM